MQNSISPGDFFSQEAYWWDMVMIATHDCVCLNGVWSNPVSDIVVRQSNQTQNEYRAMVVADFKRLVAAGFLFFVITLFPGAEKWRETHNDRTWFNTKWKPGSIWAWERTWRRAQKITDAENEWIMGSSFFVCQREWRRKKVDSCPFSVHSEEDMFEETAMERQGSAPDPGAKWIQMSEHVHKVESTCTVVVFPCSKVQSLLFIPFFLAVSHSLPIFPLSCSLCVSLFWQMKNTLLFNKYRMS